METKSKGDFVKSDFGVYAKVKNNRVGLPADNKRYVLNAYKSQYGYNLSLAPGWKLVHDDGTTVTTGREGTHFLNTSGLSVTSTYTSEPQSRTASRDDGDIPF